MRSKIRTAAVLLLPMAVLLFMYPLRLRLAPRWTLSQSLEDAFNQLERRFESSPLHLLFAALDPEGKQKVQLRAETELADLGPVLYDMTLNIQLSPKIISGTGSIVHRGKPTELSVYLDRNFAAVASENLTGGKYYGICYETFSQDIRSREVLAALIGLKTISSWEESAADLGAAMEGDLFIPKIQAEDIRAVLYGALALKPQIGNEEIHTPGGAQKVQVVTFRESGAAIAALAKPYRNQLPTSLVQLLERMEPDPNSSLELRFYLHKGKLIQITGDLNQTDSALGLVLYLGEAPETNAIRLECDIRNKEEQESFSIELSTDSDEDTYQETIHITRSEDSHEKCSALEYRWDLRSGDIQLEISYNGKTASQRLNLAGEGSTFTILSQNIRPVLNLLMDKNRTNPVICTVTVSPGAHIYTPEYRNLSQWTPEDFFSLLAGLGEWIGLKIS